VIDADGTDGDGLEVAGSAVGGGDGGAVVVIVVVGAAAVSPANCT